MSDSSMRTPSGLVVGTAGHIDHGKTSLVRALTGIDTDRLAEEKKRGISIDLGFAHTSLPEGERISFVDVPGHERFIKNMLAGVAGIDAVMLIVAADESVKPQTREHFEICRLLHIRNGIIVLTKIDLASAEQTASTISDVEQLVAGSFLANAPPIQVSAKTGMGLEALNRQLAALARKTIIRDATGFARLPVDRSFALKGFGTVLTGTLSSGALRIGDTVLLHPINRESRIRGLQVNGRTVQEAHAGQRTAVNLSGIDHREVRRGFTLSSRGNLEPTTLLDAKLEWLSQESVPASRQQLFIHLGTAEVVSELKAIRGTPYARIRLSEPVLVFPGDRLIVRKMSPASTIAGGVVIDPYPRRRMNRARLLARLDVLSTASLSERLRLLIEESPTGQSVVDLIRMTGATGEVIKAAVSQNPALVFIESPQLVLSKKLIEQKRRDTIQWLTKYHAANPAAPGAPIAQVRRNLDSALADAVLGNDPSIVIKGDIVALRAHEARLSSGELNALAKLERAFREAGFQPPLVDEILKTADSDARKARGLLETLIKSGKLIRLSPDLIYHADVVAHILKSLSAHKGRKFSVPEFKEWTQISRKYAIPLLEYLDRVHATRRDGDSRVVL